MIIDVDPIVARIGPFSLGWEGIFIGIAILVGIAVAARDARRLGIDPELLYGGAIWVIPAGLLGSRVFHVADSWNFYGVHPLALFSIGQGGAALYGAIIVGCVAALLVARHQRIDPGRLFDAVSPALALALAIGRVGDLLTGAELGKPTRLFDAIRYVNPASFDTSGVAVHPAAAYDVIWALALYLLLVRPRHDGLPAGAHFWTFTCLYAVGQVAIGFFRDAPPDAFGLGQAQLIGIVCFTVSVVAIAGLAAKVHRASSGATREEGPAGLIP
ncbi:MAG: prolipoprotein diacylglyceryl transferase [Chloroflexota bacterium]